MWTNLKCTVLRHEAHSHCCKTVATIVSRTFSSSPAETPSPRNTSSSPLPQPPVPTTFVCLYGFHCCSTAFLNRYVIIFCSLPGPCLGRCCFASAEEFVCFLPVQGLSCQGLTALTLPDSDALFCLLHDLLVGGEI